MEVQRLISVDGKTFMSTKAAADLWGLKPKTVADYCNSNKIINKFKVGRNWYISINEIKPLSNAEIHKLLVLTIQLKNNPSLEIDWSTYTFDDTAIENVYKNLLALKYIMPYSIADAKRIPYEVVLTQKGLEKATQFSKKSISDFTTIVSQWLPVLINAAQLYLQIKG